jgi:hypothetical protein
MLIIDRIEGNFAVTETDSGHIKIPLTDIIGTPQEGDILIKSDSEISPKCIYKIDTAATKSRREKINKKQKNMWEK